MRGGTIVWPIASTFIDRQNVWYFTRLIFHHLKTAFRRQKLHFARKKNCFTLISILTAIPFRYSFSLIVQFGWNYLSTEKYHSVRLSHIFRTFLFRSFWSRNFNWKYFEQRTKKKKRNKKTQYKIKTFTVPLNLQMKWNQVNELRALRKSNSLIAQNRI